MIRMKAMFSNRGSVLEFSTWILFGLFAKLMSPNFDILIKNIAHMHIAIVHKIENIFDWITPDNFKSKVAVAKPISIMLIRNGRCKNSMI